MLELWSAATRYGLWRRLWLALAEAQRELGVRIPDEALREMKANLDNIDFDAVASYDRAIALDADFAVPHFNRAQTLHALRRFDDAPRSVDDVDVEDEEHLWRLLLAAEGDVLHREVDA
jgi:hypothetical protein